MKCSNSQTTKTPHRISLKEPQTLPPLLLKYQHRHQSQTNGADDATRKAKPQIQCERDPFSKHTQLRQRLDQGLPRKFRNTPLPSEAPGKNTPFAKPTRNCSHRNSQQYPCIHVHTHTLFNDTSKENTRKKQFFFCYRLKKSNPFDMGR